MSAALALQRALYQALTGDAALMAAVTGVHDDVPQPKRGDDLADRAFPFVVLGEDDIDADDTDTSLGFEALSEIHVWSRHRGRAEVKAIQGLIYAALHRRPLALQGHHVTECHFVGSRSDLQPDGLTRHGVSEFRILFTKI